MRYTSLLALVAPIAAARDVTNRIRNVTPAPEQAIPEAPHRGPRVQHATCGTAVERLKAGPVDIDAVMGNSGGGLKYYDVSFYGHESLYWENQLHSPEAMFDYEDGLETGRYFFDRLQARGFGLPLFQDPYEHLWDDVVQGALGNCYILGSLAAAAEFPELIHDLFDSRTREYNAAGVYGLGFYVRGKPWAMDVDDQFLYLYRDLPQNPLKFASPIPGGGTWNLFVEKGWAKLKGSYENSDQGYFSTGLRAVTGAPAFNWIDIDAGELDDVFGALGAADAAGYLMGLSTPGDHDTQMTACGSQAAHAYSLISVFTLTFEDGSPDQDVLMLRNPWGVTTYNREFAYNDPIWTDALVAQVPHGIDPRTAHANGIYILPKEYLYYADGCVLAVHIAHLRDDEGYTDQWYDQVDADDGEYVYQFQVPEDASIDSPADHVYVTVETYYADVVPQTCTTGLADVWGYELPAEAPVLYYSLRKVQPGSHAFQLVEERLYEDLFHDAIVLYSYQPGEHYEIRVSYDWMESPAKDFTVKVYSKHDTPLTDADGTTNMLHTDGITLPTELRGNDFTISQMVPLGEVPAGLHDITGHHVECEHAQEMMRSIVTLDDVVDVFGHADADFNGLYTFQDLWNERPHFKNVHGAHLYYYDNNQDTGGSFWQLDKTVDPAQEGAEDKHGGGRWESKSCSNYLWDLNQWHWIDLQDEPISVMLKSAKDGLEYIKVWDHPSSYFNGAYYRQGYWNSKPHFVTAANEAHLYYFNTGLGVDVGTGYWQLDYNDQACELRPGSEDLYYGGYWFSSDGQFDVHTDFNGFSTVYGWGGHSVGFDAREGTAPAEIATQPLEECVFSGRNDCPYTDGAMAEGFDEFVVVESHSNDFYNGHYAYAGHWNCKPHFENSAGAHLYYFPDASWLDWWHLDHRNQLTHPDVTVPGSQDWYDGGFWVSNSGYQWKWDLNGEKDFYGIGLVQLWLSHPNDGIESVTVADHPTDTFNGQYWRLGYWNGKPHWAKLDNSAHLFFYGAVGDNVNGWWQLDDEDQWHLLYPGMYDLYEGGYWESSTRWNYLEDFNIQDQEAEFVEGEDPFVIALSHDAGDPSAEAQMPPRGIQDTRPEACGETFPDDVPDVTIEITGHLDKSYDGEYTYASHWNCQPHFKNEDGAHLFYYLGAESHRWHLDSRDQAGMDVIREYTRGGWFDSIEMVGHPHEHFWKWDLNRQVWLQQQDIAVQLKMGHAHDGRTYVAVSRHSDNAYNGNYFRDGYWNAQPHFAKSVSDGTFKHLYYYNAYAHYERGYWQLDWRDQAEEIWPGNADAYAGGYFQVVPVVDWETDLHSNSISLQDDNGSQTVRMALFEPQPCNSWFGCGNQPIEYDESSPCAYEFDPRSVYNQVGIPELNGQTVYTLAQLYDQTIKLFITLFLDNPWGFLLTLNQCR